MSAGAAGPSARRLLVSASFGSPGEVEHALDALCGEGGLPRDLVEVVVSPRVAGERYGRRARRPGRETFRYGASGALVGLVAGGAVSLAMLALPGWRELRAAIVIQILGPNVAVVLGALAGAAIGFFVRSRPDPALARASRPDAIVLAARARTDEEAGGVADLLAGAGGRDVQTAEADA